MLAQSQGHHIIDHLEERGVQRGWTIFLETLKPFQRQHWENFQQTGWSANGYFRAHEEYNLTVFGLCWSVFVCAH